jgi:hypothetical protein
METKTNYMEETKSILKSKTFWVNAIAALLAILSIFSPDMLIKFGFGEHALEKTLAIIGALNTVLNIGLRFISNTPITPLSAK